MAKRAGASLVIVVDPIKQRREVALAAGADLAYDPSRVDVGLEIKKATGKQGADVIIETSGSYPALQQAIRGITYAGNIAVVGWFKECMGGLHLGMEAHFNQPNLIFSRACSEPNRLHGWSFDRVMKTCWEMLAAGWFDCENIVNPIVPFAKAAQAYMEINENPDNSTKLGVDFRGGYQ
jgi:threonine dehydrogenase-like Zn-dependent dehydrogenase